MLIVQFNLTDIKKNNKKKYNFINILKNMIIFVFYFIEVMIKLT